MSDFGRELSFKCLSETLILRIKGENCDGTDFKMGVAATLPELSKWTITLFDMGFFDKTGLV